MHLLNRLLTKAYFIVAIVWFVFGTISFFTTLPGFFRTLDNALLGLLLGLGILCFGFMHKRVSENPQQNLREKIFVSVSFLNIITMAVVIALFSYYRLIGNSCGECAGGFLQYILTFFLMILSALTLVSGLVVSLKISLRTIFWVVFLGIASVILSLVYILG